MVYKFETGASFGRGEQPTFFTRPFFRFAKVACLLRSSLILAILIFLRPMSDSPGGTTVSHRSSFLEASRSASLALLLLRDVLEVGYSTWATDSMLGTEAEIGKSAPGISLS